MLGGWSLLVLILQILHFGSGVLSLGVVRSVCLQISTHVLLFVISLFFCYAVKEVSQADNESINDDLSVECNKSRYLTNLVTKWMDRGRLTVPMIQKLQDELPPLQITKICLYLLSFSLHM